MNAYPRQPWLWELLKELVFRMVIFHSRSMHQVCHTNAQLTTLYSPSSIPSRWLHLSGCDLLPRPDLSVPAAVHTDPSLQGVWELPRGWRHLFRVLPRGMHRERRSDLRAGHGGDQYFRPERHLVQRITRLLHSLHNGSQYVTKRKQRRHGDDLCGFWLQGVWRYVWDSWVFYVQTHQFISHQIPSSFLCSTKP